MWDRSLFTDAALQGALVSPTLRVSAHGHLAGSMSEKAAGDSLSLTVSRKLTFFFLLASTLQIRHNESESAATTFRHCRSNPLACARVLVVQGLGI